MHDVSYTVPSFGGLLSHFPAKQAYFRDMADADDSNEMLMMARIRSGDYFMTLATELDKMAQGLSTAQAPEAPELERVVAELLYLNHHFEVRKK